MSMLSRLSTLLSQVNAQPAHAARPCPDIDKVYADLERRARKGSSNYEPRDLQVEAVKRFWDSGKFASLRDARLVSFGLGLHPWGDKRCVMEDPQRFAAALSGVKEWESAPRQFRKCYQGLLRSYFDYDGLTREVSAAGAQNWQTLRSYLDKKVELIKDPQVNPDWVTCTIENSGLFSVEPCAAYAQDLLEGRDQTVKHMRELLGIAEGSWFTRELILSQVARACKLEHTQFANAVSRLLKMLADHVALRDRGLQLLLDRYARIPQAPQHLELKDKSVEAWGNPWLPNNEMTWGVVSDAARQMVGDWLKHEFIELFFSKLAQDGLSDTRRVKFWLKYVPVIDNIHFALGSHARNSTERDFQVLQAKLEGLYVALEDNVPLNNAFVMTMGNLVAVEFSGRSNAFYAYDVRRTLPFDRSRPLRSGPVDGPNSLKSSAHLLKLSHQDGVHDFDTWEQRFAFELRSKFGVVPRQREARTTVTSASSASIPSPQAVEQVVPAPSAPAAASMDVPVFLRGSAVPVAAPTRPTPAPASGTPTAHIRRVVQSQASEVFSLDSLERLRKDYGASYEDKRGLGGALWVRIGNSPEARRLLISWGFRYTEGKGWWKKDD